MTAEGRQMGEQIDLGAQAQCVKRLVAAVREEQLKAPTPCPEYDVRALLGHLVGLTAAFRDAAAKELGPSTGTDPGSALPQLADDWRTRLPAQLDELAAAWRNPAAWEGTTQAGGIQLTAQEAGVVALNELVVHGWDLARATHQPYDPRPQDLEVSRAMLAAFPEPEQRGTAFGAVVEVAESAPLLERVIALSGRPPSWTPEA
ncbi:TIGR03086 family metal-binding protein [Streptomyces sp. NPDC051940]|uniref:TIGR03086 family metal-binding protein n=1 Tax=Streptomyces sp. NPDC051940 TaxID=3155675 RepID=UPI00343D475A